MLGCSSFDWTAKQYDTILSSCRDMFFLCRPCSLHCATSLHQLHQLLNNVSVASFQLVLWLVLQHVQLPSLLAASFAQGTDFWWLESKCRWRVESHLQWLSTDLTSKTAWCSWFRRLRLLSEARKIESFGLRHGLCHGLYHSVCWTCKVSELHTMWLWA